MFSEERNQQAVVEQPGLECNGGLQHEDDGREERLKQLAALVIDMFLASRRCKSSVSVQVVN